MFVLKFTELENHIAELERRVKALEKADLFYGYHQMQQSHYSGFNYPDLAAILSAGSSAVNIPARPIFDIMQPLVKVNTTKFKTALRGYLTNLKGKPTKSIDDIGKAFWEEFRPAFNIVMGNEAYLVANSAGVKRQKLLDGADPNKPLYWTGDFAKHMSYFRNNTLVYSNNG
ncbi:hypothetical protein ICP12006E_084 [Vibrio phage ICP1_2006_E]|nr:hypothetical protein ICP12006E_084 [Vibrio phage ICP1_2006_E]